MDKSRFNLKADHCIWVMANPALFKGNKKPTKDEITYIYNVYNEIFNDSKKPSGCGMCVYNTIGAIKKVTEKYCDEICLKKETNGTETQTEDQKVPKTNRRKPSAKRTNN